MRGQIVEVIMLTKLIKVIQAGAGSSAFYPESVLKRDAATAFPKGTLMLNSHIQGNPDNPASQQGLSGDDLVGELIENAYFDANGKAGAGIYARAKIFKQYVDLWGDKLDSLGVSIYASAEFGDEVTESGQSVLSRLVPAVNNTIDIVIFAGAGGEFVGEKKTLNGQIFVRELAEFCGSCNVPTPQDSEETNQAEQPANNEDNDMELKEALARIVELESEKSAVESQLTELTSKIAESAETVAERETRVAELEAELATIARRTAVESALSDGMEAAKRTWRDAESREAAFAIVLASVEGGVEVAEAVKKYTEGESAWIVVESADAPEADDDLETFEAPVTEFWQSQAPSVAVTTEGGDILEQLTSYNAQFVQAD